MVKSLTLRLLMSYIYIYIYIYDINSLRVNAASQCTALLNLRLLIFSVTPFGSFSGGGIYFSPSFLMGI